MGKVKVVLISEPNVPDGLDDAAKLEGTNSSAGQERGEQEMVSRADDDDIVEVAQMFSLLEVLEDTVAAPARTQDDYVLSL